MEWRAGRSFVVGQALGGKPRVAGDEAADRVQVTDADAAGDRDRQRLVFAQHATRITARRAARNLPGRAVTPRQFGARRAARRRTSTSSVVAVMS
jgi:hypothetical protein